MKQHHRSLILVIASAVLVVAALDAGEIVDARVGATPLRTSSRVSFAQDRSLAWINPAVCDPDGNVYLVPVPKVDPRDVKRTPDEARYTKPPCDILRISPDGKKTVLIEPDRIPAFADATVVMTGGLAPERGGLRAVLRVIRGDDGHQYIVSFDDKGQYKSHQEVDPGEIYIHQFEVLGTGEFLVKGMRVGDGPRVAIMAAGAGSFRDLDLSGDAQDDPGAEMGRARLARPLSGRMAPGGDGRIYYVASGSEAVGAIEPSGESRMAFKLDPMPRSCRLVDLKASGNHLLAVYYEERPERKAAFWLAVYDTTIGERQAVYGPAQAVPVCYKHSDGHEQFTALDGATVVTMSP